MEQILFEHGQNGYNTYRIPALLTLSDGRTLAFCEGRLNSAEDYGAIHIVLRISDDNGRTWSEQKTIATDGPDTIGNPCPVQDRDTGRIWLFLDTNLAAGTEREINRGLAPRTVGYIYSDDRGETWSDFTDLTAALKKDGWSWYATGPCHALQTRAGEMVIPCNHGVFDKTTGMTPDYQAHVIYSTDHGKTWLLGETADKMSGNEAAVAELSDGSLYLNVRRQDKGVCRNAAVSRDGGKTWEDQHMDTALPDPHCQGTVLNIPFAVDGCELPLLFSNNPNLPPLKEGETRDDPELTRLFTPKGAVLGNGRCNLTVQLSLDDGKSWTRHYLVHEGHTAYGDLTVFPDKNIGCLYETGDEWAYDRIVLKIFGLNDFES